MTEETENRVRVQLQNMHARLESIDGRFERMAVQFDKTEKRSQTTRFQLACNVGIADDAITLRKPMG